MLDKSPLIEKSHLEAALAVWQYSEDSARYVFGERLDNPTAEKILAELKERSEDGMTRSEIRDLFDRHITNEKLNAALAVLLENKLAEPKKQETKGRSKEIWFVCVQSVKSVGSVNVSNADETFNAFNALDAEEREKQICSDCDKELDKTPGGQLFCPLCLSTY